MELCLGGMAGLQASAAVAPGAQPRRQPCVSNPGTAWLPWPPDDASQGKRGLWPTISLVLTSAECLLDNSSSEPGGGR